MKDWINAAISMALVPLDSLRPRGLQNHCWGEIPAVIVQGAQLERGLGSCHPCQAEEAGLGSLQCSGTSAQEAQRPPSRAGLSVTGIFRVCSWFTSTNSALDLRTFRAVESWLAPKPQPQRCVLCPSVCLQKQELLMVHLELS
uniref:Uncharacterized protein n=1 Tax=Sphaerodactylus townsendi TaxID=933632 RepID=A0ACB8FLH8_9SAUR